MFSLVLDLLSTGNVFDFVGDVADFAFATFCNGLTDAQRFANIDAITAAAEALDITVWEDGTFTIFEDGTVR